MRRSLWPRYPRGCARSRRQIQQGELAGAGPGSGIGRISSPGNRFSRIRLLNRPGPGGLRSCPFEKDVIAAVRYLKAHGATSVSVVGGSFGGAAAGDASIKSSPGEIDRIVFLGAAPNLSADKLKSRSLFIVAREDGNDSGPRLPGFVRNTKRLLSRRNSSSWMVLPTLSFSFKRTRVLGLCMRSYDSYQCHRLSS